MKKLKTFCLSIILFILSFTITGNVCYAETPPDIKIIAEQELKQKLPALNADKKHFGMEDSDDVNNAKLGEGYPYYIINNSIIKTVETNPQSASIDQLFVFDGYIFPINVGNKTAGVMYLKQFNGEWDAFQIASNLSFEKDMLEARKKTNNLSKQPNSKEEGDFKLIYDDAYSISGLAQKSVDGEFFVPIKKNSFLGINKNEVKALPEVTSKIVKVHKENFLDSNYRAGGININGNDNQEKNNKLFLVIGSVIISCLVVSIPLIKRIKKVNL